MLVLLLFLQVCISSSLDLERLVEEVGSMKEEMDVLREELGQEKEGREADRKKIEELEASMKDILDPPISFFCAYQDRWTDYDNTVSYDYLLFKNSNWDGGYLDIGTGVFTAQTPGTYSVTWSSYGLCDAGEEADIYLAKNGQMMKETYHRTTYHGPSGYMADQGSRALFVHLNAGERLELQTAAMTCDGAEALIFCVGLSQYEV